MNTLASVVMESLRLTERHAEYERVRMDLLHQHRFEIPTLTPPFALLLRFHAQQCGFRVEDAKGEAREWNLSTHGLRGLLRDYTIVCESYVEAVKIADPMRIEAIDMGRRGLHDEGAEQLQRLLKPHVLVDHETARKLFSLLSVAWR